MASHKIMKKRGSNLSFLTREVIESATARITPTMSDFAAYGGSLERSIMGKLPNGMHH
jgi:hypothetical protein